jgi:hypothetical protein
MANEQSSEEIRAEFVDKMGSDIGAKYFVLYNDVVWLHMKWQEYRKLFAKSEGRIDLLNESAATFFYVVQKTLWDDILLHVCRLTDKTSAGGKNLTLKRLMDDLEGTSIHSELLAHVADAEQRTIFARHWRNKRLAHRDLSHSLEQSVTPLPGISRANIEDALVSIRSFMNKVHSYFLEREVAFNTVWVTDDAESLIYRLRVARWYEDQRRERHSKGIYLPEDFAGLPPE